ncbi:SseB family protein [Lachnospira multipara]|uniref:SseB family protein n=1 Tax=Lachnospira multipara TaxID=28051 RepID=UPI00040A60EB|nr:SseB family protein [Lachnospira multipara]
MNILSLNEFYMIMSSKTKKPYINKQYNCYMFDTKKSADDFIAQFPSANIFISDKIKNFKSKVFLEKLYNLGIKNIILEFKKEKIIIATEKPELRFLLYNPLTEGYLLQLRQSGGKKYLRDLWNCNFFTAVRVEKRKYAKHPIIQYPFATIKNNGKFFLLFSSIDDFNKWNNTQECIWSPMEININKFDRIRNRNPIIINPNSDRIVLTNNLIKIIKEGKK